MAESTPQKSFLATAAQAEFCQGILEHLRAGLPVGEGLASLARHARSGRLRRTAAALRDDVARGASLSDAMTATTAQGTSGPTFPVAFLALVRAGERTGALADVFGDLLRQQSREARLRTVVRSGLWIPLGTSWLVLAVLVASLTTAVPATFRLCVELGAELPGLTQGLVDLSNALISYWYLFVALAVACIVWQWRFLFRPNFDGAVWRALRHVPPFSAYYRSMNAMAFLGTASALLRRGIPLADALDLAGTTLAGHQARCDAAQARAMVETGSSPTQAAWFCLFLPQEARELLQALQAEDGPSKAMEDMADYYEQRLEGMKHGLLRAFAPACILVVGLVMLAILVFVGWMPFMPFGRAIR